MKDNHLNPVRVLAVILTHERPEEFERCITNAFSTLGPEDVIAVLDDSCPQASRANAGVLVKMAGRFTTRCCHIPANDLHHNVAQALRGQAAEWQLKTGRRDIAPLRNISLLISAAVRPQTTVLIDDDVCGFDVLSAHELLNGFGGSGEGLITGAAIGGFTDLDTVTRLSNAMQFIDNSVHDAPISVTDLFQVTPSDDGGAKEFGCVSAGFMVFRLQPSRLFAFPPGYNEDWLWCLLHRATGESRVLRTDQMVLHKPKLLRRPSREDLLFEVSGDVIFDSVGELTGSWSSPESLLRAVPDVRLKPSVMPRARAEAALTQFENLSKNGQGGPALSDLENHGLTLLRELLEAGELELAEKTTLSAWSEDALAKHHSFASTIENSEALAAIRKVLTEGRT